MKYSDYYERVSKSDNGYDVEAVYEFDGTGLEYGATVDTVTAAHAKLREFRADFRLQVNSPSEVDIDPVTHPSYQGTTQGV